MCVCPIYTRLNIRLSSKSYWRPAWSLVLETNEKIGNGSSACVCPIKSSKKFSFINFTCFVCVCDLHPGCVCSFVFIKIYKFIISHLFGPHIESRISSSNRIHTIIYALINSSNTHGQSKLWFISLFLKVAIKKPTLQAFHLLIQSKVEFQFVNNSRVIIYLLNVILCKLTSPPNYTPV